MSSHSIPSGNFHFPLLSSQQPVNPKTQPKGELKILDIANRSMLRRPESSSKPLFEEIAAIPAESKTIVEDFISTIPAGTQEDGVLSSKKSPVSNSSEGEISNLDGGHQNWHQKPTNDMVISDFPSATYNSSEIADFISWSALNLSLLALDDKCDIDISVEESSSDFPAGIAKEKEMNVSNIRYNQNVMNRGLLDGRKIEDCIQKLAWGNLSAEVMPPIRVVCYDKNFYALDNECLFIYKNAFLLRIKVHIYDLNTIPESA